MFSYYRSMACVICVLWGSTAWSATDTALAQCRGDESGDIAVAECLSLLHEESEVALAGVEESLGNLLATTVRDADIGGNLTRFWSRAAAAKSAPAKPEGGTQVIAIIDGVATAVDESVLSDEDDTDAPLPSYADAIDDYEAEQRQYRAYRDRRCSWSAQLLEPGETAWREISCRVQMNRQRIDELRTQLNQRLAQRQSGFAVRGFLQSTPTQLSFQPCGSSQKWAVSADDELTQTLSDQLRQVSEDSRLAVYAELSGNLAGAGDAAVFTATRLARLRAAVAGDCELDISISTLSVSQQLPADRATATSSTSLADASGSDAPAPSAPPAALRAPDADSPREADSPAPPAPAAADPAANDDRPVAVSGPGKLANASDDMMYGYFQGWAAACETGGKRRCHAFSDSEPSADNIWQLQIVPADDGGYEIVLVPRQQDVRIGRNVGIYVDQKPVADSRLSPSQTRLKTHEGVVLKRAADAQTLLGELRRGTSLLLRWTDYSNVRTDVNFTLWGLSRALSFNPEP